MKDLLEERPPHTAPKSLRPRRSPLQVRVPPWLWNTRGQCRLQPSRLRVLCEGSFGSWRMKSLLLTHQHLHLWSGEGVSPVLCADPHGVRTHPPQLGRMHSSPIFKADLFSLWEPPDGGAWTWKSFTLSYSSAWVRTRQPPAAETQPIPIYSGRRLDFQGPLSDILENVNVRCSIKI